MTQEEKQLLLVDLCARLPYGINCVFHSKKGDIPATLVAVDYERGIIHIKPIKQSVVYCYFVEDDNIPKPYLRPISSMTEEEKHYIDNRWGADNYGDIITYSSYEGGMSTVKLVDIIGFQDWLNAHHFDYRGLIEQGLALPAPKGLYTH